MPGWARTALILLVAIAVVAVGLVVYQQGRVDEARNDAERLRARLRERAAEPEEGPASSPLEDLFGGLGDPPGDASGDLFGDLLGGSSAELTECLAGAAPATDPDALLGGLFGDPETLRRVPGRVEIKRISRQVEDVRNLTFRRPVDATFLPPDRLGARAARLFLEDYPRSTAEVEGRMLSALGAIPHGTDLRALMHDLLKSQVAGFYVPESKKLFVPGNASAPLDALEKTIVAHELEHAVADQRLDIDLEETPDPAEMDESIARLAVIEGDATLTMQTYSLANIPVFEQLSMLGDPAIVASQAALEGVPHYIVAQLEFPYLAGLEFVCDLHSKGGWKAVDRAYSAPPETTAEVLWPERYRSGDGDVEVADPAGPGAGWNEELAASLGAANLVWLFEAPGADESRALADPEQRAQAWAGGEIRVWSRDADTAVAVGLRGRGSSLCGSMKEWYESSFDDDRSVATSGAEKLAVGGDRQAAVLECRGTGVRLAIAPVLGTARAIFR